ncbi:hypothetical protein ACIRRX_19665 [Streptomyces bacillaris]|uniref:hypothetical protein n=1 Tax=unclassified Streptomyces TaxID=2593676 RepID=UPI00039DBEAE|nr:MULTISPECIES: hypothetical protein [unclassified Streptomyces]MYT37532.1 hypothetical protein [Streptomyces sp. SID8356]
MGILRKACTRCTRRGRLRRGVCRRCRLKEHGAEAADAGTDVAEVVVETGALGVIGRAFGALVRALLN